MPGEGRSGSGGEKELEAGESVPRMMNRFTVWTVVEGGSEGASPRFATLAHGLS